MLEIYLFINPLGSRCFRCERDVLKIDHQLNTKVNYRFIPFFNMATIQQTIEFYHLDPRSLAVRQNVSNTIYRVILDYMAASFQGKKRGRQFLLMLQDALIKEDSNYSDSLVKNIALQSKLDLKMFLEDRNSTLAKKTFHQDQQFAQSLGITRPSTAVVFDTKQSHYGFLLNNFDYETLITAYKNKQLENDPSIANFVKHYQSRPLTKTMQK
ncbi:DsbA family protein [Limosilactobacillus fastidiosus]|uniref:DsbA family protein n=1 Tax=Limosilactobacillus fastidiosus TaxID=2759855 RepID=A0A7W3TXZ1_9LACO|nr:DsbA family protein [Limosilactobacillus fastidiosus]MBB1062376.1 DsbA family protein [Limosilactobacillus fastidiosus]MBB1085287.1 DsbA family protein [Limosilactobacillus fastidiosus]MCD7083451.1 DsbA family protein [Limosilactobacillus fastidiosus]MCD7085271.1 DsbA family protein [Limosilactobacillus fastidiosus]MCD7115214.1 DsbA family protein [Limosilactobacillus fastidiosus]